MILCFRVSKLWKKQQKSQKVVRGKKKEKKNKSQVISRHLYSQKIRENLWKALCMLPNHCLCNIQSFKRCIENENVLTRWRCICIFIWNGIRSMKRKLLWQLCKLGVKHLELWMNIIWHGDNQNPESILDELHCILTVTLLQKFNWL